LSGCHRAHWQKRSVMLRTALRHDENLTQRCTWVRPGRVECKTRKSTNYSCEKQSDSLVSFVNSHCINHWWRRQRQVKNTRAAFQRRILDVSNPTYKPKLNQKGAGVRDGLTNEFVNMLTYQVLIQTLQLSEAMRTKPAMFQEGLKTLSFRRGGVQSDRSLWLSPKQTAASLCHERLNYTSRCRSNFFSSWAQM
jgi:hypothetical protein